MGSLWDLGIFVARFEPTFTKNLLNVSEICFPFVIELPLDLNSEAEGLYLHLLMIVFIICQDFFRFDLCFVNWSW